MITRLLQFELLLCRIITKQTRPTFLWIPTNAFLFEKNRQNGRACNIKSNLSVNNYVFQTGYELKTQHGLGTDSPSCLASHSQTACLEAVWIRESSYILPRRQKVTQHEEKASKITFLLNADRKISSVLVHCVTE